MPKKNPFSYVLLIVLLGAVITTGFTAIAPSSVEAAEKVIGSWEASDDNSPAIFVMTFHRGGTISVAYPNANTSNSGGNWRKAGRRRYRSTEIAFIYDSNGDVEFRQKTKGRSK